MRCHVLLPLSAVLLAACTADLRPSAAPSAAAEDGPLRERNEEALGERGTPVSIPVRTERGVTALPAEIVGDLVIMGGDMILGTVDELLGAPDQDGRRHAVGVREAAHRWEDRTVPYQISSDLSASVVSQIETAIADWEADTSLDFVEATSGQRVVFQLAVDDDGFYCASNVGRQDAGTTEVSLLGCTTGNIRHEIGHAIGLYHEHQRCDRDDYVIVNDTGTNYDTVCDAGDEGFDVGPYDLTSIMHYGSNDETPRNLTDLDGNDISAQRSALTAWDIAAVERMYGGRTPLYKDINSDGYEDLLIGAPGESTSTVSYAGAVTVVFGTDDGLVTSTDQQWTQNSASVPDSSEASDNFGRAVALGDFDSDGYADAAVGTPYEDLGSDSNAGAVTILWGSGSGLTGSGSDQWHQDSTGIQGDRESGDYFGDALVAGDFDGDSYADLAIGVPYEDVTGTTSVSNAGAVNVIYGGPSGLAATAPTASQDNQIWHRDVSGVAGSTATSARMGASLATGDFNGDGYGDLAAGVPGDTAGTASAAGAAHVFYGSSAGLTATGDEIWSQATTDIDGSEEAGDRMGEAVAVGDLDCDGYDDLVVGAPYEDIGSSSAGVDNGAVHVIYGSASGLTASADELIYRTSGVSGSLSASEALGSSLTVADFDGDGCDDLVIGVPGYDGSEGTNQGQIVVVPGSTAGLDTASQQAFDAGDWIWTGLTEAGARFGSALTTGDWDQDGYQDLAIGAYMANESTITYTGGVYVLFGDATGLDISNREVIYQDLGVISTDTSESYDYFGYALN